MASLRSGVRLEGEREGRGDAPDGVLVGSFHLDGEEEDLGRDRLAAVRSSRVVLCDASSVPPSLHLGEGLRLLAFR